MGDQNLSSKNEKQKVDRIQEMMIDANMLREVQDLLQEDSEVRESPRCCWDIDDDRTVRVYYCSKSSWTKKRFCAPTSRYISISPKSEFCPFLDCRFPFLKIVAEVFVLQPSTQKCLLMRVWTKLNWHPKSLFVCRDVT